MIDKTLRGALAGLAVVMVSSVLAGCSGPTLEEACAEYCNTLADAGCENSPKKADCDAQCGQAEEQLDGKCVDEYTDTLDCAAGEEVVCREGYPTVDSSACTNEALDLFQCLQDEGVLQTDQTDASSG